MNPDDLQNAKIIWDYLKFADAPAGLEKADFIIGLGSLDMRTADHAAELYLQKLAPKIIFTGGFGRLTAGVFAKSEAELFADRAVELGVPRQDILLESKSTNTGENITHTYELLLENNLTANSLILVTKPYMLRRAYATFMKQWPSDTKPKITCSAIDLSFEDYCQHDETTYHQVIDIMVGDLQRIKEYPRLGFQIEQQIPNEVWGAWRGLVKRGYVNHLLKNGNI